MLPVWSENVSIKKTWEIRVLESRERQMATIKECFYLKAACITEPLRYQHAFFSIEICLFIKNVLLFFNHELLIPIHTMCDFHNFGLIFAGQCIVCLKG